MAFLTHQSSMPKTVFFFNKFQIFSILLKLFNSVLSERDEARLFKASLAQVTMQGFVEFYSIVFKD